MEILRSDSDKNLLKECEDKENSENCIINKYLASVITKEGYINYKVYKKLINTDGANCFGTLRQIDVKGNSAEGTKETNLFFKLKMPNWIEDNLTVGGNMFPKEAYIYNNLSSILNHLQKEANIPVHERYSMAKSYDESDGNAIILENLAKKGYKALSRLEVIPIHFMKQLITNLAKLHGLSFVLDKKMPNYIMNKTEIFQFPVLYNDKWQTFIKNKVEQEVEYLDSNFQAILKSALPKLIEKIPKYMRGELASVKCLCHGDYRPSNIMVKEEKGELLDIISVDYQTLFFGSPVTNFIYFINCSTDRQYRKKHLEQLKDHYYESLKRFLNYFQIEADSVYTRDQFDQDLKDYFDYGIFAAMIVFSFFFVEDEVPDLANDNFLDMRIKLGQTYKDRMEGVIQDYIDEGYL